MSIQTPFGPSDTIATLAQARSSGAFRFTELTERALDRAEALKKAGGHALTRIWREEALTAARREDQLHDAGVHSSLLAGMAIVVKDNCDVRGDITQAGSGSLANALPAQRDAYCIAQLRARERS